MNLRPVPWLEIGGALACAFALNITLWLLYGTPIRVPRIGLFTLGFMVLYQGLRGFWFVCRGYAALWRRWKEIRRSRRC